MTYIKDCILLIVILGLINLAIASFLTHLRSYPFSSSCLRGLFSFSMDLRVRHVPEQMLNRALLDDLEATSVSARPQNYFLHR